jgi:hypothetical protein
LLVLVEQEVAEQVQVIAQPLRVVEQVQQTLEAVAVVDTTMPSIAG